MEPATSLSEALVEVRRSYRTIYEYQKRVLSLVLGMAEHFPDIQFLGMCPNYYYPTPQTNADPVNVGTPWRYLPLFNFSLRYLNSDRTHSVARGDWMLEISVSADAGYDWAPAYDSEPDSFPYSPEKAASTAGLYLHLARKDFPGEGFADLWWGYGVYPYSDQLEDYKGGGIFVYGKDEFLENLGDPGAIEKFVADFKKGCYGKLDIDI